MTFCKNTSCSNALQTVDSNYCIHCGEKIRPYQPLVKNTQHNNPQRNITIIKTGKIAHRPDSYNQWLNPTIGLKMQYLPIGQYWMGSDTDDVESESSEKPQHFVAVEPFYMSSSPITQLQYKALVGVNPSHSPSYNLPVETVSYFDAAEFCRILSEQVGRTYRLPTEGEWEYACRANTNTPFSFGKTIDPAKSCYRTTKIEGISKMPSPIEAYQPNQFGLYDMHGNVWEWCQDRWHDDYKNAPRNAVAWMCDDDFSSRVIRGGSWQDCKQSCRSASRDHLDQSTKLSNVGFRVVCEI
jgi:formylglycine-generating enzyme required for sulfatase activity